MFIDSGKFLGVLKRKQILGKYFQSTEKDDETFVKKVNFLKHLSHFLYDDVFYLF